MKRFEVTYKNGNKVVMNASFMEIREGKVYQGKSVHAVSDDCSIWSAANVATIKEV